MAASRVKWTRVWLDENPSDEFYLPVSLPEIVARPPGQPLLWADDGRGRRLIGSRATAQGPVHWAFEMGEWLRGCLNMRGREPRRPIYTRVPGFDVYRVPARLRAVIFRSVFSRTGKKPPTDTPDRSSGVQRLAAAMGSLQDGGALSDLRSPVWPDRKRAALIFTADVDSEYIFASHDNRIRRMLEEHGFRAAWFFLTGRYKLDHGHLEDLRAAGHEIGWHGHNHDHRMAFVGRRARLRRIDHARAFFERYQVCGMRADNFLWSRALFDDLRGVLKYDTSMVDAFPFTERGRGCATGLPFRMDSGLWQLPTTVTPDCFLSDSWPIENWLELQERQVRRQFSLHGVIHLLVHPEPAVSLDPRRLELFGRVLGLLDSLRDEVWHGLPMDLFALTSRDGQKRSI